MEKRNGENESFIFTNNAHNAVFPSLGEALKFYLGSGRVESDAKCHQQAGCSIRK
jgi:hypothetical protein